jgi:hypothetical protein
MSQTLKVYDDSKGGGACRSCHAPITWFELTSGKRHPVNGREPAYLRTAHEPGTHRLIGEIDGAESHFATCPDAKSWSRGKATQGASR